MNIVEINDLTKKIGKTTILDKVNLKIEQGKIVALIGKNGAGKTTLINLILDIYKCNIGEIKFNGLNRKVIFDTPPDLKRLTLREYLNFFSMLYTNKEMCECDIDKILSVIKLEDYKYKKVSSLSFGMQKKIYISTLLIDKADLLILDEPFNGLDFESIKVVKDILKLCNEKDNSTIIVSSHLIAELETFCNTLCIVEHGKIIRYESINSSDSEIYIRTEEAKEVLEAIKDFIKIGKLVEGNLLYINKKDSVSNYKIIERIIREELSIIEIFNCNMLKKMLTY